MKRLIQFAILLFAGIAGAQITHVYPALDTNNNFTGINYVQQLVPGFGTYAQMQAWVSPPPQMVWFMTDATSVGECGGGGGTFQSWCGYWDGHWVPLGGGGGGGGTSPGCNQYDVQVNYPTGTFGGDCGIFTENPSTHIVSDTFVNASQQLRAGDATHSGLIQLEHTNGSSDNATFKISLDSTFSSVNSGYGVNMPDSPAVGALAIISLTPNANGLLPTAWSTSSLVSCENVTPLDTCNAPYPATTSDVTYTLERWGQDNAFMGPLPPTFPTSNIVQDATCGVNTVAAITCTFPNPFIPGDTIYAVAGVVVGTSQNATFVFTDSNFDSYSVIDAICPVSCISGEFPGANAYTVPNLASGGNISVTVTPTCPACFVPDSTSMHVMELRPTAGVDTHAIGATYSMGTITFGSITTSHAQDFIIATTELNNSGGNIFTAGSGYSIVNQFSTPNAGGNYASIGTEVANVSSTGTYTPTIVSSASSIGLNGFVVAWKSVAATNRAQPYPRLIHPIDLQARAIGAVGSGVANYLLTNDSNPDDAMPWVNPGNILTSVPLTFGTLPASPVAGMQYYCSDCQVTTASGCSTNAPADCVCKASGTGAFAKYFNFQANGANWYCQ